MHLTTGVRQVKITKRILHKHWIAWMRQSRACFARTGHLIRYMTRKAESSILIGCKSCRVKRVSLLRGLDGGGRFHYVLKVQINKEYSLSTLNTLIRRIKACVAWDAHSIRFLWRKANSSNLSYCSGCRKRRLDSCVNFNNVFISLREVLCLKLIRGQLLYKKKLF